MAIGVTVLATGGLVFWQHTNAVEAASQAKQQEIQLENKKLDLEMLKEMNQASAATSKAHNSQEQERQKQIAACIDTDKGLVGKQMGVNYSSLLRDCQAQYPATADGSDMQTTASSSSTGGGGVNGALVIGGVVLVSGVAVAAFRRSPASNAQ